MHYLKVLISSGDSLASSLAGKLEQALGLVGSVSDESGQSDEEDDRRLAGGTCVPESVVVEGSPVGISVDSGVMLEGWVSMEARAEWRSHDVRADPGCCHTCDHTCEPVCAQHLNIDAML